MHAQPSFLRESCLSPVSFFSSREATVLRQLQNNFKILLRKLILNCPPNHAITSTNLPVLCVFRRRTSLWRKVPVKGKVNFKYLSGVLPISHDALDRTIYMIFPLFCQIIQSSSQAWKDHNDDDLFDLYLTIDSAVQFYAISNYLLNEKLEKPFSLSYSQALGKIGFILCMTSLEKL